MVEIVQRGHKALSATSAEVPPSEISSKHIQKIIADMKTALKTQGDGVGLAAPQIGINLRIFIISGRIFHPDFRRGHPINQNDSSMPADLVFINPEIIKISKKTKLLDEGCLSVRPYYGKVKRAINATVRAFDESGTQFIRGGSGLLAHIFQHEVDHLNGVLFIDKAVDVHESNPEEAYE